jgi:hypothetical protein
LEGILLLTPAQQKIRQELEELHVKGLLHDKKTEPDVALPPRQQSVKKTTHHWWIYFGFAFILLAGLLIIKTFHKDQRQETAAAYLNKIRSADRQSEQLLENVKQDVDGFHIQTVKTAQAKLLQKVKQFDEPAGFAEYQEDFLAVMQQRLEAIAKPTQSNFITLEVKEELAKDSLRQALKRQHIPFTEKEDGTIEY